MLCDMIFPIVALWQSDIPRFTKAITDSQISQIAQHYVKSVHIQSFSGPYFPVFGLNTEGYGPEKLLIRKLFTRCKIEKHLTKSYFFLEELSLK